MSIFDRVFLAKNVQNLRDVSTDISCQFCTIYSAEIHHPKFGHFDLEWL
jgi:hypothetical protein